MLIDCGQTFRDVEGGSVIDLGHRQSECLGFGFFRHRTNHTGRESIPMSRIRVLGSSSLSWQTHAQPVVRIVDKPSNKSVGQRPSSTLVILEPRIWSES